MTEKLSVLAHPAGDFTVTLNRSWDVMAASAGFELLLLIHDEFPVQLKVAPAPALWLASNVMVSLTHRLVSVFTDRLKFDATVINAVSINLHPML